MINQNGTIQCDGGMGTYRLQLLLDFPVQSTGFNGDDLGGSIRIVSDRRTAFGAEDTVDLLSRGSYASPALGGALDAQFIFRDHRDESYM